MTNLSSTDVVRVCDGVEWEMVSGYRTESIFPEFGLERLAVSGLDDVVKSGDFYSLKKYMGERVSNEGDPSTRVCVVHDDPSLVVKLSNVPFPYIATNVALGAGLGTNSQYSTPDYMGALFTETGQSAVIMTRAIGKPLGDIKRPLTEEDDYRHLSPLREKIRSAGRAALHRVGLGPDLLYWDLNTNNIFIPSETASWLDLSRARLTVIDQTTRVTATAQSWWASARIRSDSQDVRDVRAEQESEKAWAKISSATAA